MTIDPSLVMKDFDQSSDEGEGDEQAPRPPGSPSSNARVNAPAPNVHWVNNGG